MVRVRITCFPQVDRACPQTPDPLGKPVRFVCAKHTPARELTEESASREGVESLLRESDVTRRWRVLFRGGKVNADTILAAQQLIDQLPLESPLRMRYSSELNELRKRMSSHGQRSSRRRR